MEVQRREFELEEIHNFYSPRQVYDDGDYFSILPFNDAEGPIIFQLPRILPIDKTGRLINPTAAYDDYEHQIADALHTQLDGDVYLRLGLAGTDARALRQKLILDDTAKPNVIEIIIDHYARPAWGGQEFPQLPDWTTDQTLVSERVYLCNRDCVDFILLKLDCAPADFLETVAIIRQAHRLEMFGEDK